MIYLLMNYIKHGGCHSKKELYQVGEGLDGTAYSGLLRRSFRFEQSTSSHRKEILASQLGSPYNKLGLRRYIDESN